ncbi:MAG: hypothetical protein ABSH14_01340 [Verrucomicrobiia bacterium]|jgi:hypothetical protein
MENPSKHVGILQHRGCESLGLIADSPKRAGAGRLYIRPLEGNSVPHETGDVACLNGTAIKLNAHTHLLRLQNIGRPRFAWWIALLT